MDHHDDWMLVLLLMLVADGMLYRAGFNEISACRIVTCGACAVFIAWDLGWVRRMVWGAAWIVAYLRWRSRA